MNSEFAKLQKELIALMEALRKRLPRAASKAERDALLGEIQEVFQRSITAGRLAFEEAVAEMEQGAKRVTAASEKLRRRIAQIETVAKVVEGVSKLLTAVDELLDVAKGAVL